MKEPHVNPFYYDNEIPIKEEIILRVLAKKLANDNGIDNNNTNGSKKKTPKKDDKVNRNKDNKGKRIVLIGLFILFLFIFIGSLFKLVNWYKDNQDTDKITEEIGEITNIEEVSEDENKENIELVNEAQEAPKSDYWYYITFPLIQVDFDELVKKNADTVAWIQVNNTNINYPVVQTDNNDYYLTRSYDKTWNDAGWVFMDFRNSGNLNDRNTIIYAHSRLDKTMFGSLSKVLKADWYKNKDNHIIKMSTPTENSLWQIFSVYKIEAESYYITTEFENDNAYIEFLNTLKERSKYNFDVTLSSDDSIITLSTCYSETERTVVHAKKIKKSARIS